MPHPDFLAHEKATAQLREELDRVTRLLGGLCKAHEGIEQRYEGPGARAGDYRQAFANNPELMAWWRDYKAVEAAQVEADRKAKEAEDDALQRALAKLSPAERDAVAKNAHLFA